MRKSENVKGRSLTVLKSRRKAVRDGKSRCDPKKRQLHRLLFTALILLLPIQLGRHFWPQWSYVLGLRVDYLSPTIYLTDILILGILLSWIWESLKIPPRWTLALLGGGIGKKNWWVLSIFLFLFVNCFFAQNQAVAFYKFAKIIEFALLALYIAKNHSLLITNYSITFSIPVIYSSLIAITQFIRQSSLNGVFYWLGERTFDISTPGIAKAVIGGRLVLRPYATFPHPNVLAGFVLVSLALIVIRNTQYPPKAKAFRRAGVTRKIKPQNTSDGGRAATFSLHECGTVVLLRGGGIKKALWWLAIVLGIVAILISFSRSTWLVGLMIGFWWLMINLKISRVRLADQDHNDEKRDAWRPPRTVAKQRLRLLRGETRFFLITIYLLLITFVALLLVFKLPFSTEETVSRRLDLAKISIAMIKEFPLIGVGLNNFLVRLPDFWQEPATVRLFQPVHNIFLLVAAETGIVGLLIFFWFLILTYKRLLNCYIAKLLKRKNFKLFTIRYSLTTSLTAVLLLGLFDHYFLTLQQTQLLFSLVLGLCYSQKQ